VIWNDLVNRLHGTRDLSVILRDGCCRCLLLEDAHGPQGKCLFEPSFFQPFPKDAYKRLKRYWDSSETWSSFGKRKVL
jgi:hypothetical protein